MRRAILASAALALALWARTGLACKGTLYLTIDTGSMSQAETVARILARHEVKATFFLANEKTVRGDFALDPAWGEYWRARVAEGHAFGSHTWHHGYFRGDLPDGRVRYAYGGATEALDAAGVCAELRSRRPRRAATSTSTGLTPGSSATSCRRTSIPTRCCSRAR